MRKCKPLLANLAPSQQFVTLPSLLVNYSRTAQGMPPLKMLQQQASSHALARYGNLYCGQKAHFYISHFYSVAKSTKLCLLLQEGGIPHTADRHVQCKRKHTSPCPSTHTLAKISSLLHSQKRPTQGSLQTYLRALYPWHTLTQHRTLSWLAWFSPRYLHTMFPPRLKPTTTSWVWG